MGKVELTILIVAFFLEAKAIEHYDESVGRIYSYGAWITFVAALVTWLLW